MKQIVTRLLSLLLFVSLAGWMTMSSVAAAPPERLPSNSDDLSGDSTWPGWEGLLKPHKQDPRPSGGGSGSGGGGSSGGGDSNSGGSSSSSSRSTSEVRCASLQGQVIHWGVGGMSGVSPRLNTGSWELAVLSENNGSYNFGGLGVGIANLQFVLPPAQAETLQPTVSNAGVYLSCDRPLVANIAVAPNLAIEAPATIEISGPATVEPGSQATLTVTVNNKLPNDITNVVVTSLMPAALTAVEVSGQADNAENLKIIEGGADGQLVSVFLDKIASGEIGEFSMTVMPAAGVSTGMVADLTASLFYSESVAVQDTVSLTIGPDIDSDIQAEADSVTPSEEPAVPVETAPTEDAPITESSVETSTEISAETSAETETVAESEAPALATTADEAFVPPSDTSETGEFELEPPVTLPVTGQLVSANQSFWPLGGLGLVIVSLLFGYSLVAIRRHL